VTASLLIASLGLLVASTLQAATGFGIALVAAPVLYAVAPPPAAVALVLVLSQVVNVLVIFGERRRLDIEWRPVRLVLLAALPGLVVGALLVRSVPAHALQTTVGIAVCLSAVVSFAAASPPSQGKIDSGRATIAAGFAAGALTTSTTTNGPPIAIWLAARHTSPAAIRDVASLLFAVLDVVGLTVLVAVVGPTPVMARASWLPLLAVVAIVGHAVGRRTFLLLPARLYQQTVRTVALLAGLATLASALR
jgi:uncharacterized membrane protein YfcA